MKEFVFSRAREASTWRALLWVVAAFNIHSFTGVQEDALTAFMLAMAGAGMLPDSLKRMPDRKR